MELKDIRSTIDQIDDELLQLFVRRMEASRQVRPTRRKTVCPYSIPAASARCSTAFPRRRERGWSTMQSCCTKRCLI